MVLDRTPGLILYITKKQEIHLHSHTHMMERVGDKWR